MSYDPDIAAARRVAKHRSRATGASYQSMLDEVARGVGCKDWKDFLAHPRSVAGEPADHATHGSEEADTGPRVTEDALTIFEGMTTRSDTRLLFAVGLFCLAAWAMTYRPFVQYLLSFKGDHDKLELMAQTFGDTGAFLIIWGRYVPITLPLMLTWLWRRGSLRGTRRQILRIWLTALPRIVALAAFFAFMPSVMMTAVEHLPSDDVDSFLNDKASTTHVRFVGGSSDIPIMVRKGPNPKIVLVLIDGRLIQKPVRNIPMSDFLGGAAASAAYVDHPVLRISGSINCATGLLHPDLVEFADAYRGRAAYSKALKPKHDFYIRTTDLARICRASRKTG